MLTLQLINKDPEDVIRRLAVKQFDGREPIMKVVELDKQRREAQKQRDDNAAQLNKMAAQIGALMKQGKKEEAQAAKQQVGTLKAANKEIDDRLTGIEEEIRQILLSVPNVPYKGVPEGKSSSDNVVEKTGGKMPDLPADALPHWELAKKYDIIDFDLGVKITGAGFPVYKGKGARLQRALIQFFLDEANKDGYLEIEPPGSCPQPIGCHQQNP